MRKVRAHKDKWSYTYICNTQRKKAFKFNNHILKTLTSFEMNMVLEMMLFNIDKEGNVKSKSILMMLNSEDY